ncbi:MAG: nitrous oxide reductase accessory protein NosL [Bacteroidales bacterium]|nr:nitrous oxide reductase accessory protein NosL [Bacteroidales bacterium]
MKINILLSLLLSLFLCSCTVAPVPIDYGKDACHFCKMNIVDNQHAAEIVSKKGKAFKYDALECMLNDMKGQNESDLELILTTTYDAPGVFLDVHLGTYLISENMPSPMGANLNAFMDKKLAESAKDQNGGVLLNWEELNSELLNK